MEKPQLPSGTRDFSPQMMLRRKYILSITENVFKLHGFGAIETPALENLKTLQGKYGDEGDQLLFKVLNSGDFLSKANDAHLSEKNSKNFSKKCLKIRTEFLLIFMDLNPQILKRQKKEVTGMTLKNFSI
jgi:histidyl-tRNA synthetase